MLTSKYIKCDRCGGVEELDALQYSTGVWIRNEDGSHTCPLCQKEVKQMSEIAQSVKTAEELNECAAELCKSLRQHLINDLIERPARPSAQKQTIHLRLRS